MRERSARHLFCVHVFAREEATRAFVARHDDASVSARFFAHLWDAVLSAFPGGHDGNHGSTGTEPERGDEREQEDLHSM
jgi:hypothetical protein